MRTRTSNLFGNSLPDINKPTKSYKFDTMSLYYKGAYYFTSDLKEHKSNTYHSDKQYSIQVVFNDGKWRQDTYYITKEFRDFLLDAL